MSSFLVLILIFFVTDAKIGDVKDFVGKISRLDCEKLQFSGDLE